MPSAGDNVTSKSISAPSNAKCDLWEQNVYGDPVVGPRWKELMEGDDNRFSSGIPKDNKRLERSDNKPHSEEQAAMETRKRRRDAAEHFAKNFSILDALRSNLPEVFAAEILPKFDLLSTLSLAQVNKKYRDEVWSVNGVSSLEPKIKAHSYMLMERAKKNGGMHGGETYWNTKPMYWAVKHGNVPAVRALLASGVDVDRSLFKEYIRVVYVWDDFGPLHLAADEGWLPVVKALIQAGANVDNLYATTTSMRTPTTRTSAAKPYCASPQEMAEWTFVSSS